MSDTPPRISVVIPCKGRQSELLRAIDTVLAQTLPAYEIVVVDDGSTTPLSVPQHPAVTLIRQNNTGPAGARNTGVRNATGDWIALLDSDDTWYPNKLERQWQLAQATGADFCFANMDMSSWGIHMDYTTWLPAGVRSGVALGPVERFVAGCYVPTSTIFVRRSLFDAIGGFDTSLPFYEDLDITIRLAHRGKVAADIDFAGAYVKTGDSFGNATAPTPKGIRAEIMVLRKVWTDSAYPRSIRQMARRRLGPLLHDLAYRHRHQGELRDSVRASLHSLVQRKSPRAANMKNIAACTIIKVRRMLGLRTVG